MHYEFNALECYISPNGHPMPMVIENITDESEYNIDDRKYYAQSYQIKLMAYIIRKEDFKVTKVPSRFKIGLIDSSKKKKYKKVMVNDCWLGNIENSITINKEQEKNSIDKDQLPKERILNGLDECENKVEVTDLPVPKSPSVVLEEVINECFPKEANPYANKIIKLIIDFPYCEERSITFTVDTLIDIESIETENVKDFVVKINGVIQTFEDEVKINPGDEIFVSITREDEYTGSSMTIIGIDPETVIDTRIDYESALDEPVKEEDIYVNKKGTE